MSADDSVYPIAILIDELKSDDIKLRLNSINRLPVIAASLGPERTRNELIPYLNDSIDDEDEVLIALAEALGGFLPLVGGEQYSACLLSTLELLCNAEETVVREKAVGSLNAIASRMPAELVLSEFMGLIKRLAGSEWATSRSACCGVMAKAYTLVPEKLQGELRELYAQLCKDSEPLVRRAACTAIKQMAEAMKDQRPMVLTYLVPLFVELSKDDQDSVRLLAVSGVNAVGRSIGTRDLIAQYLLGIVKTFGQDRSWRVRFMLANEVLGSEVFGDEVTRSDLVPIFTKLVQDPEAEVRAAMATKTYEFCEHLQENQLTKDVIPLLKKFIDDTSQQVRASFAGVCMKLSKLLGKPKTVKQLLPMFVKLLQDEHSEVRLNTISNLEAVNQVIGSRLLSENLLPAIRKLCDDKQWRVRLAIVNEMPCLAAQLGEGFFEEHLSSMSEQWLTDRVHEIRSAAAAVLKQLTERFGSEWARKRLMPALKALSKNPNYLYRQMALKAVRELSSVVTLSLLEEHLVPLALSMSGDRVPNVRFVLCKAMHDIVPRLNQQTVRTVQDTLRRLQEDPDIDVKHFATTALAKC